MMFKLLIVNRHIYFIWIFCLLPAQVWAGSSEAGALDQGSEGLGKAIVSFSIEDISLQSTPSDITNILSGKGFKLKKSQNNKKGKIYTFKRKADRKYSIMRVAVTPDEDVIQRIDLTVPPANNQVTFTDLKTQIDSHFSAYVKTCKWDKQVFRCQSYTEKDKLTVVISMARNNTLKYQVARQPSKKAERLTQKRQAALKAEQLREEQLKLEAVQEKQRAAEASRLAIEKEAKQKELARLDAERQAQFLKSVAGHPCDKYDVTDAQQVLPCIQTLYDRINKKLGNAEKFSLPWPIYPGRGCAVNKSSITDNLVDFGFSESEASKRVPSCAVIAGVYKLRENADIYWAGCLNRPEQPNSEFIASCTRGAKLKSYQANCEGLRKVYSRRMKDAGYDEDTIGDPGCDLINGAYEFHAQWQEQAVIDYRYKTYYKSTPAREQARFTPAEHMLVKNGKLVVPDNYGPPGADEIRLAVMRSMVDRRTSSIGDDIDELKRKRLSPIVVDGRKIFLTISDYGFEVSFLDPIVKGCKKRNDYPGYLCKYTLATKARGDKITVATSANSFIGRASVKTISSFLSYSQNAVYEDWFVLKKEGWKQPHTDEQKELIERKVKAITQRAQKSSVIDDDPLLVKGASIVVDLIIAPQAVRYGVEVARLR